MVTNEAFLCDLQEIDAPIRTIVHRSYMSFWNDVVFLPGDVWSIGLGITIEFLWDLRRCFKVFIIIIALSDLTFIFHLSVVVVFFPSFLICWIGTLVTLGYCTLFNRLFLILTGWNPVFNEVNTLLHPSYSSWRYGRHWRYNNSMLGFNIFSICLSWK